MTEFRSERENLLGTVERRAGAERLEFREDKSSGEIILQGYAATYQPYDCHGGPDAGGWVEQLDQRAFDETLAEKPDVQLLINHTGTPLARTKSGTLKLTRDSHGLRVWASLDPTDPDVQALVPKMRRGDMDEMSFAFRVTKQAWNTSYSNRTISALSLEKGDVSVVNYGMNPTTKVVLADAVGMLSQLSTKELVELRNQVGKLDGKQVKRAAAILMSLTGYEVPPGPGSLGAPAKTVSVRDDSGDYGDVTYADPGYKEGKKRYPINNKERAKAAWSYINMPKNQKGYTSTQVSAIKGRIKAALKKFGVETSDDADKSKGKTGLSHIEQVYRADGNITLVAVMMDGSRVPLPTQAPALPAARGDLKGNNGDSDWDPGNVQTEDPHDNKYEVGPMGLVAAGPIPDNIQGGGNKFTADNPSFAQPSPEEDPHDQSFDTEEKLSMDPHDGSLEFGPYPGGSKIAIEDGFANGEGGGGDPHHTPYTLGGQVGRVPGDRPNVGTHAGDSGRVPDNIMENTPALGGGSSVSPGTPPSVGTGPVVTSGDHEWDWSEGSLEPGDPAQELDAAVRAMEASCDPHDTPTLGGPGTHFHTGGWEPTNIEGGSLHKSNDDADDGEHVELGLDMGMVEALERTIVHCYKLAEGNQEVRQTLAVARKQLYILAGKAPKPAGPSDIQKRMAEIRSEVGDLGTGTVTDYMKHLRAAGSAPVGYGGLLDHDPQLHVTTPAERLAREALESDRRARTAAQESDKAAERLKAAQREAELNDAIRRHRQAKER
jgi:HK97 family phage prohead protease